MPRWAQVVVCLMLVSPFLVLGLLYLRHRRRLRVWTRAEGRVVDVRSERRGDGNGGTDTTTTVTYRYDDLTETQRHGTTVNPEPVLRLGQAVDVRFRPDDPDRSIVVGSLARYHVALAVFFLLFVPGVLGLLGVVRLR